MARSTFRWFWSFFSRRLNKTSSRRRSGKRGMPWRVWPRMPLSLERLEEYVLPSVTLTPDPAHPGQSIVQFTQANAADNLTLQLAGNGDLQYKLGNAAFTNDLDTTQAGVQSRAIGQISQINVSLAGGADTLTLD